MFLLLKKKRFLFRISVWMLRKQEGEIEKRQEIWVLLCYAFQMKRVFVLGFQWADWYFALHFFYCFSLISMCLFLWGYCIEWIFFYYSNSSFFFKSLIMCFDAEKVRGEKEKDGLFYLFWCWENKLKRWMFCLLICWLSWALPLPLPSFFCVIKLCSAYICYGIMLSVLL